MKIWEKIEKIRLEPEHIRMRWVWICLAISMFFIVAIWIFSMTALLTKDAPSSQQATDNLSDLKQQLGDLKNQAPSLKTQPLTTPEDVAGSQTQDQTNQADGNDFAYPSSENQSSNPESSPQSSNYSNLTPGQ